MDKELEVPSFVNDNYNKAREEQENQRRIEKLKIYKKVGMILVSGTLLAVAASNPTVQREINVRINKIIEKDNENLHNEYLKQAEEVLEVTGSTPEEIMQRGQR